MINEIKLRETIHAENEGVWCSPEMFKKLRSILEEYQILSEESVQYKKVFRYVEKNHGLCCDSLMAALK